MDRQKKQTKSSEAAGYIFHFVLFVTVFFAIIGGALFFLHAASAFGG